MSWENVEVSSGLFCGLTGLQLLFLTGCTRGFWLMDGWRFQASEESRRVEEMRAGTPFSIPSP